MKRFVAFLLFVSLFSSGCVWRIKFNQLIQALL